MERLRYVARAGDVPVAPLVREAAAALMTMADDPMGLLTSCRRLVDRRPGCAPLMWLAARMLTGADSRSEAADAVAEIEADPTGHELDHGLGHGWTVAALGDSDIAGPVLRSRSDLRIVSADAADTADVVVLESDCVGPSAALVPPGAVEVETRARASAVPVWLVAGVGRVLPERMWDLVTARLDGAKSPSDGKPLSDGKTPDLEVLDLDRLVTQVVTPVGLRSPEQISSRIDCPSTPELFRTG